VTTDRESGPGHRRTTLCLVGIAMSALRLSMVVLVLVAAGAAPAVLAQSDQGPDAVSIDTMQVELRDVDRVAIWSVKLTDTQDACALTATLRPNDGATNGLMLFDARLARGGPETQDGEVSVADLPRGPYTLEMRHDGCLWFVSFAPI
jgi:hypothetical protein